MNDTETITDFITGQTLPNVGAEVYRQKVEKLLINQKGYRPADVHVNYPLAVTIGRDTYQSRVDLVVEIDNRFIMAIKCAAGSLGSRQREILAAARLLTDYQVPISVVSSGETAIVLDSVTGEETGTGLAAIPDREGAKKLIAKDAFTPYPQDRWEREAIIFRSYDTMNVNVVNTSGGR